MGGTPAAPARRASAAARRRRPAPGRAAPGGLFGAVLARPLGIARSRRTLTGREDRGRLRLPFPVDSVRSQFEIRRSDRGARSARRDPCGRSAEISARGHPGGVGWPSRRSRAVSAMPALSTGEYCGQAAARCVDLQVLDRDPWDDLVAEVGATMVAGRRGPAPPWEEIAVARAAPRVAEARSFRQAPARYSAASQAARGGDPERHRGLASRRSLGEWMFESART